VAYQGIAPSFFKEPEYRNPHELAVGAYLIVNRDSAGVVPITPRIVAPECRITRGRLDKILTYFDEIEKIKLSTNRTHAWLKSGIYHSLFKGKYSAKQMRNVCKTLAKWSRSAVFQPNFAEWVTQVYASQYSLRIPIADYINSYTNSYIKTASYLKETKTGTGIKIKFNQDLFDQAWSQYVERCNEKQRDLLRLHYFKCQTWYASPDRDGSFPTDLRGYYKKVDEWIDREPGLRRELAKAGEFI
jgi:hypothetical protein